MSECDQQSLSDEMHDVDAPGVAQLVYEAAQAIVAAVGMSQSELASATVASTTTPQEISATQTPRPTTPALGIGVIAKGEDQAPPKQATSGLLIEPIRRSPPATSSTRQDPPSFPEPSAMSPASSVSVATAFFPPIPSSSARPVYAALGSAGGSPPVSPETTMLASAPASTAPRGQETKNELGWKWHEHVWNPDRQALFRRMGWYAVYGLAGWFACVTVMIVAYRFVNPPASNLMLYNYLRGNTVHHTWVPLEKISPTVIKAVVVAEDAQFCRHWGIDFAAIQYAIEHAKGGTPRGASTISMQTAKNMFLWQSKSYVRKVLEVPVTVMMELIWPKKRMLEVYLNIAEWGPGVFGIGAAAKHHFNTTPAKLGGAAASRLAASLPNPKVRRAGRPGPKTRRKANVIRGRARKAGYYTGCVLG